jgi:flagellar hook-associated protein 2
MTTNTINSNTSSFTNAIDVSSIVSQLMSVANQPKISLQNKIANENLIVSDLGTLQSKMSSLQSALQTLENPQGYLTASATSTDSSIVNATVSNGASKGRYQVGVIQTAEASSNPINFGAITDPASSILSLSSPFQVQIGSTVYSSDTDITIGGKTLTKLSSNPTLNQLSSWINSLNTQLGLAVSSNIVQTSAGNYSLIVSGTKTGEANAVSIPNGGTGSNAYVLDSSNQILARDAIIKINGIQVQRSSNTITDIFDNNPISFSLGQSVISNGNPASIGTPQLNALITVSPGTDPTATNIQDFVTNYNAMITQYKLMIANSNNSSSGNNGSFATDPMMLSFVQDIKQKISSGFITGSNHVMSLSSIGIDLQIDGSLKFNSSTLSNFTDNNFSKPLDVFASGIHLGGSLDNSNSFVIGSSVADSLQNILAFSGNINQSIQMENSDITNNNSKLTNLQSQLDSLQKNYISQYSNLNSLLFNLSQVSSQLTSSLTAVTNINSGK